MFGCFSVAGHFMFCCSQKQDKPVTMLSPVYEANEEGRCLIFWARSSYSVVDVHLRDREGHQTSLEIIGLTSDWMAYHIDIRSRTDFQVIMRPMKYVLLLYYPVYLLQTEKSDLLYRSFFRRNRL